MRAFGSERFSGTNKVPNSKSILLAGSCRQRGRFDDDVTSFSIVDRVLAR